MADTRGTLVGTEPHPAVESARVWYNSIPYTEKTLWIESFASAAIEGNRLAEICLETMNRMRNREMVSDRYFLGLVWTMRFTEKKE